MGNTPLGFPYPEGSEALSGGDDAIKALALAVDSLLKVGGTRLAFGVGLAITNNVHVALPWGSVDSAANRNPAMWAAGTPTRLIAPVNGRYRIAAGIPFTGNATGVRQLSIGYNKAGVFGTPLHGVTTVPNSGTTTENLQVQADEVYLGAGNYMEVFAYQNCGGGMTVGNVGGIVGWASMTYLGPGYPAVQD